MQLNAWFILFQFLIFNSKSYVSFASPLAPITNIRDAKTNEFPFLASIGYKGDDGKGVNSFCTGALIRKKFILTSAHCFEGQLGDENPEDLQVKVNASVLSQTGKHYDVRNYITYDDWAVKNKRKINHNDIAIMLLTEEAQGVQSGELKAAKISSLNNKTAAIIGYGGTDKTGPSNKLQVGNVRVLPQSECIKKYRIATKSRNIPTEDHICTQGRPYDIMQYGDSGSPLLDSDKKIIGVSSYTTDGTKEAVNIHLTIEDHMDFIDDVTNNPQKYF